MSLRARLLVVMLLLVTAGLLAADVVTYRFLSSFLLDRVDQQLEAAIEPSLHELSAPGGLDGGPSDRGAPPFPAGTYAAVLSEDGEIAREHVFRFEEQDVPSAPDLPSGLPGSTTGGTETERLTVDGQDGDATYRVLALAFEDGGTLVVAIPLTDVEGTLGQLLLIEAAVTVGVLAALTALAWWLVRMELRPLERMGETAGAIAAGDLSRRVEPSGPRTEVSRLGLALNTMLGRIEEAFTERQASEERLRRFVADASHELRTPLTSVQGYAELFRHGAADRPEDLSNAMRRIEEESRRMGGLVDELALLARLDQGRPLEREPVDLVAIAEAAVDAARVAEPARPIDLHAPGAVAVVGDAARLRQIADNLLSNARGHTPTGSAVHVRVRADGDVALLEVEDEGPGIAEEHEARVFERFFRADPSRARDSGGAGLGLSIVAAVAEAHGGDARYERASGGGARFEVRIPIAS